MCILIPAYNEAQGLKELLPTLKKRNFDIIVVDDGSSDESASVARGNGAIVLSHPQKKGKGCSLRAGFEYILKNNYDGVIMMDGDGQHDPEDLDQFVQMARQMPPCIITGNRMHHPEGMPWVRLMTNYFMSFFISLACRQMIPDTQCGYRYISRDVLGHLKLTSSDFEIETEILMKVRKKGFRIYSVPIKTIYRNERSHIRPLRDTWRFIIYFLRELCSP